MKSIPGNIRLLQIPQINPNDYYVDFLEWRVSHSAHVDGGVAVASVETSKSVIDITADVSGYLYHLKEPAKEMKVGEVIGFLSQSEIQSEQLQIEIAHVIEREANNRVPMVKDNAPLIGEALVVTKKAREVLTRAGLTVEKLNKKTGVIKESDVLQYLRSQGRPDDSDRVAIVDLRESINRKNHIDETHGILEHGVDCFIGPGVSLSNVRIGDRVWINKGATIYGKSVQIGSDSYVGPYVWIEGHAGVAIGRSVHIAGPGTCLYTHSGMKIALQGGPMGNPGHKVASDYYYEQTISIGNNVWIGPNCTIFPGVVIENNVVVMPNALVKSGLYPSYCLINPDGSVEHNSSFVKQLSSKS